MKHPLVSIITPCYNGEAFLDRYFQAILAQTYPCLELIFVNDGSTDRTQEIALAYREKLEKKGIRYIYEYQDNAGQAAALNRGLKIFTGEYLAWKDADDAITPDSIQQRVSYLMEYPDIGMVRSNGLYIDEISGQKKRISTKHHAQSEDIFKDLLLVNTFGCPGCYMISKELFLKCYPDRTIYDSKEGQNWQLLVPAASYSLCGYIDMDLNLVYEHSDSHSRKKRSHQQMYERWDAFTDILINTIQISQCDKVFFTRLVLENCARQKFYYAVDEKNKQMMKTCIAQMKKNGKVSLREYILFLRKMML